MTGRKIQIHTGLVVFRIRSLTFGVSMMLKVSGGYDATDGDPLIRRTRFWVAKVQIDLLKSRYLLLSLGLGDNQSAKFRKGELPEKVGPWGY